MTNLVERLRNLARTYGDACPAFGEAADEIEHLQRAIARAAHFMAMPEKERIAAMRRDLADV